MWFWLSAAAAVLWGLQYAISGRLLETMSSLPLLFAYSASGAVAFGIALTTRGEWGELSPSAVGPDVWKLAAILAAGIVSNFCITASIQAKNATLSSLVEISYPVFTAAFAYLLFGQRHLGASAIIGGALVFVGTILVARS